MSHRQSSHVSSQSQVYRPITVSLSTYTTRKSTLQGRSETLKRRAVRFVKYAESVTP